MEHKSITFRGQEVIVVRGSEEPKDVQHTYAYGIRGHVTESIPLKIEDLNVDNKWGTILTDNPIALDCSCKDNSSCKYTNLKLEEVMEFMGYN